MQQSDLIEGGASFFAAAAGVRFCRDIHSKMGWLDKDNEKKRIEGLPSWILTPKEEKEVLEEYQREVWRQCDKYVQEFKKCEAMAGFGVLFKCREQSKAMKACVVDRHQHEYVDEVRDAYIQKKLAKRQAELQAQEGSK